MSVVILDSQMVHYESLGRGRPLIFLHGWVGSWRYWIPVMQAASVAFRAYAIDFWGFGDSAKAPAYYSLDRQIGMIDQFLYEMGIGRVAFVGHGLGAVVAMQYALQHPEVVDRVMAVGYPLDEAHVNPRLRTSSPADLADWLPSKNPLSDAVRADASKTDTNAVAASLNGMSNPAVQSAGKNLRTNCLLVAGQNDPAIVPPEMDAALTLPETIHTVWFDQSGHFPMLDESSKFNRLMIDFLSLPSDESPRTLQLKEEWRRRVR